MSRAPSRAIDLAFRPTSYWDHTDPVAAVRADIKGQNRRELVTDLLTGGASTAPDGIDVDLVWEAVDQRTRVALGALHPSWLGGEYLPTLLAGEVEIARLVLDSVTQDVLSIRARRRRGGRRWLYRVVDEYHEPGRGPWRCRPASSAGPLTLGELITLIDGARDPDFDEAEGALPDRLRAMLESYDPGDVVDFVRAESDLYPGLSAWCAQNAQAWVERERQILRQDEEQEDDDAGEDDAGDGDEE